MTRQISPIPFRISAICRRHVVTTYLPVIAAPRFNLHEANCLYLVRKRLPPGRHCSINERPAAPRAITPGTKIFLIFRSISQDNQIRHNPVYQVTLKAKVRHPRELSSPLFHDPFPQRSPRSLRRVEFCRKLPNQVQYTQARPRGCNRNKRGNDSENVKLVTGWTTFGVRSPTTCFSR